MKVWLNGDLAELDAARIAPNDRGLLLGDGLFETFAARGGQPVRLDKHIARLAHGCSVVGMPMLGREAIERAVAELLTTNDLTDAVVRLTYTRGPAPRGVAPPDDPTPTVMLTAGPLPASLPPVRLHTAQITRRNEHSPLSGCKHLNYLDNILAAREAKANGADDAVLLNTRGMVTETTIANIFAVIDGGCVTPPLTDGCLPGTAREALLRRLGIEEWSIPPEALATATEIVVTSSLGPKPVIALDGRTLEPGSLYEQMTTILSE